MAMHTYWRRGRRTRENLMIFFDDWAEEDNTRNRQRMRVNALNGDIFNKSANINNIIMKIFQ